ncbi:MAG: IS5 family transposase [Candidatus Azotimanducaceae bacterium]
MLKRYRPSGSFLDWNILIGVQLSRLADILDSHVDILLLVEADLVKKSCKPVGRSGLSVENMFRCLILRQIFGFSYEQLAFHLSDSMRYRTFVRLPPHLSPKKSCLQSTIRSIKPATLERIHQDLVSTWHRQGHLSVNELRIDSTVVSSHIAPPSDSQLLNDGVRALSRCLAKSRDMTGIKLRFTDQRKASKSLAFQIFNAKKAVKNVLYLDLLKLVRLVLKQVERNLFLVNALDVLSPSQQKWVAEVVHYRDLLLKVVDQIERRVIHQETVPSSEKVVSLFEEHTDIIVKGLRVVQYGHKINLSSEGKGFITTLLIEEGNPADPDRVLPVLEQHQKNVGCQPTSVACDGGSASKDNVEEGRALGIQHVVFHKRVGISYLAMGVKQKTFKRLRNFRAGIEGNISELNKDYRYSTLSTRYNKRLTHFSGRINCSWPINGLIKSGRAYRQALSITEEQSWLSAFRDVENLYIHAARG